jgi:hypothetical protein
MTSMELLACHMVGDYITQTGNMAANKLTDSKVRARHVCAYAAGFVPFVFASRVPLWRKVIFLTLLWTTHFVTDSRRWASGEEWPPKPILVDQALHSVQLALLGRLVR